MTKEKIFKKFFSFLIKYKTNKEKKPKRKKNKEYSNEYKGWCEKIYLKIK